MQYNIHGDNMPVVICSLDDGESMICEAGAMSWRQRSHCLCLQLPR